MSAGRFLMNKIVTGQTSSTIPPTTIRQVRKSVAAVTFLTMNEPAEPTMPTPT